MESLNAKQIAGAVLVLAVVVGGGYLIKTRGVSVGVTNSEAATDPSVSHIRAICPPVVMGGEKCFNSLSAWQSTWGGYDFGSCAKGDLVCAKKSLTVYVHNDWAGGLVDSLSISGWKTDLNDHIKLLVAEGSRHKGVAGTGFVLLGSITVNDAVVKIDGFEIKGGQILLTGSTKFAPHLTITRSIIHDFAKKDGALVENRATADSVPYIYMYNSILYNFSGLGGTEGALFRGAYHGLVYNNTLYNSDSYGVIQPFDSNFNSFTSGNNYIGKCAFRCWKADYRQQENYGIVKNVLSDASNPSEGHDTKLDNRSSYPSYFVSVTPGAENLHLVNSSDKVWGTKGGTVPVELGQYVYNDDVDAESRPTSNPDIGADQFGQAVLAPLPNSTTVAHIRANCPANENCFTSLSAWQQAWGGYNFAADGCVSGDLACIKKSLTVYVHNDWPNGLPDSVIFTGWKSSGWSNEGYPTYNINISAAPGERHSGKAGTGARIRGSLTFNDGPYNVEGLEIVGGHVVTNLPAETQRLRVLLDGMIIHDYSAPNAYLIDDRINKDRDIIMLTVSDTILYNVDNQGTANGGFVHADYSNQFFNITAYNSTKYGFDVGHINALNLYIGKCTDKCWHARSWTAEGTVADPLPVSGYTVVSDGPYFPLYHSATGKNAYADYFVNVAPGQEDFHLKSKSTALWGVEARPDYALGRDIDNVPRIKPYDVGADQYTDSSSILPPGTPTPSPSPTPGNGFDDSLGGSTASPAPAPSPSPTSPTPTPTPTPTNPDLQFFLAPQTSGLGPVITGILKIKSCEEVYGIIFWQGDPDSSGNYLVEVDTDPSMGSPYSSKVGTKWAYTNAGFTRAGVSLVLDPSATYYVRVTGSGKSKVMSFNSGEITTSTCLENSTITVNATGEQTSTSGTGATSEQSSGSTGQTDFTGSVTAPSGSGVAVGSGPGFGSVTLQDTSIVVTSVPAALKHFFAVDIVYGSKSSDIAALQNILKYEGYFPQTVPNTGYYGPITAKALLAYQFAHAVASPAELISLGGKRVGPKTRAMLNNVYGNSGLEQ